MCIDFVVTQGKCISGKSIHVHKTTGVVSSDNEATDGCPWRIETQPGNAHLLLPSLCTWQGNNFVVQVQVFHMHLHKVV